MLPACPIGQRDGNFALGAFISFVEVSLDFQIAERAGIRVAPEAWIDRTYDGNGNLLPHTHSRAIIKSKGEILKQATSLIRRGQVHSSDGGNVSIDFQSIHLHAKMPYAKEIAEEVRNMLPHACSLTSEPFAMDFEDTGSELAFS